MEVDDNVEILNNWFFHKNIQKILQFGQLKCLGTMLINMLFAKQPIQKPH